MKTNTNHSVGPIQKHVVQSGWKEVIYEGEKMLMPEYRTVSTPIGHVKFYYDAAPAVVNLNGFARAFLDYAVLTMDKRNWIFTGKKLREIFLQHLKDIGVTKIYTDAAVKKAINDLVKENILQYVDRSAYLVNPNYFFKQTEDIRIKLLKSNSQL